MVNILRQDVFDYSTLTQSGPTEKTRTKTKKERLVRKVKSRKCPYIKKPKERKIVFLKPCNSLFEKFYAMPSEDTQTCRNAKMLT